MNDDNLLSFTKQTPTIGNNLRVNPMFHLKKCMIGDGRMKAFFDLQSKKIKNSC